MKSKAMVFALLVCWVGCAAIGLASGPAASVSPKEEGTASISWQTVCGAGESRIIPGTVQGANGSFPIRWVVGNGAPNLVTLEAPGAGELPPVERRLMLLCEANGRALLFHEWFPLLNQKQPVTIRMMAPVSTAELFRVLPNIAAPPASPPEPAVQPVVWEKTYERNGIAFVPGHTVASFGTLNLLWRKAPGRLPELITIESPGAGELPPLEVRLYLWNDLERKITVICRERQAQLGENYPACLWRLATVSTIELMKGF